jgi:hypothetical protein
MTRQTERRAGSTAAELTSRRRRFLSAIEQIHAHQPAAVLRGVAVPPSAPHDAPRPRVGERPR